MHRTHLLLIPAFLILSDAILSLECQAQTLVLEPVTVEQESSVITQHNQNHPWEDLSPDSEFKYDSTGVQSLSYQGLSGPHLSMSAGWHHTDIPMNSWFDGSIDLRLISPFIFHAIQFEQPASSFKRAVLRIDSSRDGYESLIDYNSLDNFFMNAGMTKNSGLFRVWGSNNHNLFTYQNGTRTGEFNELENKMGMVAGFSKTWNHLGADILTITGYREAEGGGVIEYPLSSQDALSRSIIQLSGVSFYHQGISSGPWIYQPTLRINNRLNYLDYSNPRPLIGQPIDQQHLDDCVNVQFINAWHGAYPFNLSFDYTYQLFQDLSANSKLQDASENTFRIASNAYFPFFVQSHFMTVSADAGIFLSENHILPVAGLQFDYQYASLFKAAASIHYISRLPDYSEKYYVSENVRGDPNLKPEQGYHAEISLNLDLSSIMDSLDIDIHGFFYDYDDAIHWIPVTSYMTTAQNLSDVIGYGGSVHIKTGHHFNHWRFVLTTGYYYTHLTTDHYDIPYHFRHRLVTDFSIAYEPLSINLKYQFYKNARYNFSEQSRMSDRNLLDLSIQYTYRWVAFELYIQNLLDDRTMFDIRQRPLPGMVSGLRIRSFY